MGNGGNLGPGSRPGPAGVLGRSAGRYPLAPALLLAALSCRQDPGTVTAWRVRADAEADLNADTGWAAPENTPVAVEVDRVFRIRFELDHPGPAALPLRLEARWNGGVWFPMEALDHPYPEEIASAVASIVAARGYTHGEVTEDLLRGSPGPFVGGQGVSLRTSPLVRPLPAGSSEWEWPLVIRYFSDGARRVEPGDTFDFRLVRSDGRPLRGPFARVFAQVPPGHLGGTYVETPGRIGPFEASNGDLYFIQEPAETDNVFMVVKSEDGGRTWREVDGAHRPREADLESVSAVLVGGVLHILHQADEVWYHSFRTSDHPTAPDSWGTRDELVAGPFDPPTQAVALVARPDGSLVGIYAEDRKIRYRIFEPEGPWGEEQVVDPETPDVLSGPVATGGEGMEVHLAYVDLSGRGWLRRILPDGSLSPRLLLTDRLGTRPQDRAAILPLVWLASSRSLVAIYRTADGLLWERRLGPTGALTPPRRVSNVPVASGPVDSHQVTADAIGWGEEVHVLFVEAPAGDLWHVAYSPGKGWGPPSPILQGIVGQWVRGSVLIRGAAGPRLGFVVDTGSYGGSGMNRFGELPLTPAGR